MNYYKMFTDHLKANDIPYEAIRNDDDYEPWHTGSVAFVKPGRCQIVKITQDGIFPTLPDKVLDQNRHRDVWNKLQSIEKRVKFLYGKTVKDTPSNE